MKAIQFGWAGLAGVSIFWCPPPETAPLPAATQKKFILVPWLNCFKSPAQGLGAICRYLCQQKATSNKAIAHPGSALPLN